MAEEQKPKVEGKKPHRAARPQRKEFTSEVVGLTTHTFNIGHPKYAAQYGEICARAIQIRSGCRPSYEGARRSVRHYACLSGRSK